jgi:hypothetical protein
VNEWTLVVAFVFLVLPILGVWLVTRTRVWRNRERIHWAGEVPIWWRNKTDIDLPPELLDRQTRRRT